MRLLLPLVLALLFFYQLRILHASPHPKYILRARRERGVSGAFLGAFDGRRVKLGLRVEWRVQVVLAA